MESPQAPATNLTSANRINVPAVCRLPGRGTACVVSPGLLLTSTRAIASKADAARGVKAVFFEGGKRDKVTVDLRPDIFFFASAFPAHVDYCLVACDTDGIRNVAPVKLPLLQTEIPIVREGDTLLVIQHPLYSSLVAQEASSTALGQAAAAAGTGGGGAGGAQSGMTLEVKRFEEVLRRRDDVFHLRSNSAYTCFGCPCFNDDGLLVGLQAQLGAEAPPSINPQSEAQMTVGASTVLAVSTIVKHMFANGHLGQIDRPVPSEQLWASWGINDDAARTVLVIQNFHRSKELYRKASLHLYELVNSPEHVRAVAACNGGPVVLSSMSAHFDDPVIVAEALKALWNLGLVAESSPASQLHSPTPVEPVIAALTKYGGDSVEIAQVAVVLLFNAAAAAQRTASKALREVAPQLVYSAMKKFVNVEVLQKFGFGFLRNMLKPRSVDDGAMSAAAVVAATAAGTALINETARGLVDGHIIEHATAIMIAFPRSEFLHEHATGFLECVSTNATLLGHPSLQVAVPQLIASILRFPRSHAIAVSGCNALWGLGNDPIVRTAIFTHESGVDALRSAMSVGHSKK